MIKIQIGNSASKLYDVDGVHFKNLRKILSYKDTSKRITKYLKNPSTGKYLINPKTGRPKMIVVHPVTPLMDKYGVFPTGLLYLVLGYIKKFSLEAKVFDTRTVPKTLQFGLGDALDYKMTYTPYPEQEEAAVEAYKKHRGIIVAPTGVGKSAIAALIISKLQVPTLIVVPSVELKNQLTDSLRSIFGSKMVGPLVNRSKKFNVTVENVDQLDFTVKTQGFDCLIIDEFHRSGAATYRKLNHKSWNDIYYRFGLTATPFRSKQEERLLLESILSKVIYRIEYETSVYKNYIVPVEPYFISLPKIKSTSTKWQTAYKELVVDREDRNEIIVNLIEDLHSQGKSTLVLVKQIEHGLKLQAMAKDRGIPVPFAQGINDDNKSLIEAFNDRSMPILIGTAGVIGEGIDTRPCEYVIMAGGGRSKNAFMQQCGRGFRVYPGKTSCKIIMFHDPSNKWLKSHFEICIKYLEQEYQIIPTKLEI